ncbi:MAG: family 10 glycosylhydrolase, partial [Clostridiales bacterium]|nr:family 10 glycosylhydrolase [Clostridiales bacterium]
FIFSGCTISKSESETESNESKTVVKSVWMTYYELSVFTLDNKEKDFKKSISACFKELNEKGFNRITVQVRPCADAFYDSAYFPVGEYCFGNQGDELEYDPLKIMVNYAHKYGLTIEAWINPYRVHQDTDFSKLSNDNIALEWKDSEKLIVTDSGIYFNPASNEVTELIVNGVKEIVQNYDVDSICFDDYFYPTQDESIDEDYYNDYKSNGGDMSLADWRRDNVNNMVKSVYSAIKELNSDVTFGISPAANISNNYSSLYADVELWSTSEGYVDYICPQIYFGFKNESQPFMKTAKIWAQMAQCDLYVALPLYKCGKEDTFAGDLGINEFVENDDIISRQVTYLSKLTGVDGYYIFSYSFLSDDENETLNLYSAMQNSFSQ